MKSLLPLPAIAKCTTLSIAWAALLHATLANAEVVTPTGVFASTYYHEFQVPQNLINDSHWLVDEGDVMTNIHAPHESAVGMWHAGSGQGIEGASPEVGTQYLVFDLGGNYDLSSVYLWQFAQTFNDAHWQRAMRDFRLLASPDAPNLDDVANPPPIYDTSTFTEILPQSVLELGELGAPSTTQVFALTEATNVRQVYLQVISAHSGQLFDYVGFAEIKFEGVSLDTDVPGDFNGDGNVDGADFVIWQTNFPNNTGLSELSMGDANGDGNVDGADFVIWQTNFPTTGGTMTPVPEPSAWLLAIVGSALAIGYRRPRA